MTNNVNFKKALEDSGLSMYELAKYSGVPYTTVNELNRGKLDINQCATGTVFRLAAILEVKPEDVINPINYLDGVKGRYKGIDYTWETNDSTTLLFEYKGDKVILDTGARYNIPDRYRYYEIIAGWMIQEHLDHDEWEKRAHAMMEKWDNE